MEKEENLNKDDTQAETIDENIVAEQKSDDKQENNKSVEEEKELSLEEKIKELEDKLMGKLQRALDNPLAD